MMFPRSSVSPIPMYHTSGFDSEMATAPTDELAICPSVTGFQVLPASVVFPQTAADRSEVVFEGPRGAAGGSDRAASAVRPDVAPFQSSEIGGIIAIRAKASDVRSKRGRNLCMPVWRRG